ncbi:MAG: methyl-accepting chemotaxis protein [Ectothiorhodospiraceae bacterium]|nr:methyl-accepting chemotaxis protein [Ectothiorhodospiraceae bacterium]
MNWFHNLKIKYKILFLSIIGVGGFLVYFSYNYSVASSNAERMAHILDVTYPMLEKMDAEIVRLDKIKGSLKSAVIEGEEELLGEADAYAKEIIEAFREMSTINKQDVEKIKPLDLAFTQYYKLARSLSTQMIDGSIATDTIQSTSENMGAKLVSLQEKLERFRNHNHTLFINNIKESVQSSSHALFMGMIIGGIVLVLLLISTPLIIRMISGNLSQVVTSLKEMAAGGGDLTKRLESHSTDELGDLVLWFNRFVEQLQKVVSELKDSSIQLSTSSSEVTTITEQSSQQISRQESETELVATAVNEMAATVQEVASHANNAATATQEADQEAKAGRQVVTDTVDAIDALADGIDDAAQVIQKLESDSQQIGTVLDVIRGIADQTNLLALNAAIEAARAGDQGRGFAVVADEVRTLASRTQQSTQEIDQMIERLQHGSRNAVTAMDASREQAQKLVGQAAQAGESLQTITQAVGNIADMNLQIASATEEQSSVAAGIDQSIVIIRDISVEAAQGANQAHDSSQQRWDWQTKFKAW